MILHTIILLFIQFVSYSSPCKLHGWGICKHKLKLGKRSINP